MQRRSPISLWAVVAAAMLSMGVTACESYRLRQVIETTKTTQQEVRVVYVNQQEMKKDKADLCSRRLKTFYMQQNDKMWGDLADYAADATIQAAKAHRVDLSILVGVVSAESGAAPFAKSGAGAEGMSQIMFGAHGDRFTGIKERRDRYDPKKNIDCAAELLSEYVKRYGLRGGLTAYNVGKTAYSKGKRNDKYVRHVLKLAQEFRYYGAND